MLLSTMQLGMAALRKEIWDGTRTVGESSQHMRMSGQGGISNNEDKDP